MIRSFLFSFLLAAGLSVLACNNAPESQRQLATQPQALSDIGSGCYNNASCASDVCFHTWDAMPPYTPWESGNVCTELCTEGSAGDTWCRELAAQYGAPRPQNATCLRHWDPESPNQQYRYACDLIAAGLGSYWSE